MPRLTNKLPSLRQHKASGRAIVTLNGRDHYLGPWNSAEAHAEYDRLIAEWLTSGRGQPQAEAQAARPEPLVNEVVLAFWRHAEIHYRGAEGTPTQELENLREALKPLSRLFGHTPARLFGPLALRAVRDDMVRSGTLARGTINARINRIRRVIRWAVSVELVPATVDNALGTVEGLQKGRTQAREADPVEPVPAEAVEATFPFLPRPVAAMVKLQLLTACRAGEVMAMRGCDLTPGEPTWEYRPASHKTAWRGKKRVIPLGPQAVEIIREFLRPDTTAYLFAPADAVEEMRTRRREARTSRPTPSELKRRTKRKPGETLAARYDRRTYRQAIVRACRKAGVAAWSPLQLRHTAATAIRARYGLEATSNVLGHAKADVTQIYAERDLARARSIAAEIG